MGLLNTPPEYESFGRRVVIASTVLGGMGGLAPFLFGALPGIIGGWAVGIGWVRCMVPLARRRRFVRTFPMDKKIRRRRSPGKSGLAGGEASGMG